MVENVAETTAPSHRANVDQKNTEHQQQVLEDAEEAGREMGAQGTMW
jgi:hypothetical protein